MLRQEVQDAVAGGLSHGRKDAPGGGGAGRGGEHERVVRALRSKPQDWLQVGGTLPAAWTRRVARAESRTASGAVGDRGAGGGGDSRAARGPSELGSEEAARQAAGA